MSEFAPQVKADFARQEILCRHYVHPRLIRQGLMSKQLADRQMAILREIVADYEAQGQEELSSLFGETKS